MGGVVSASMLGQTTRYMYLSGTGVDNPVKWDFFCSEGANSGKWTTINVPGHWETQGFGGYNYGHDRDPHNEKGFYRYEFEVPSSWKGSDVYINFEGSMTDTDVRINGESAGPTHQGSFYPFKFNITPLLKPGKNLLEVAVTKESANRDINLAERRADYWIFGGLFRPVYLTALPSKFIERVAIDARHTGDLRMEVVTNTPDIQGLTAETTIYDSNGKRVAGPFVGTSSGKEGVFEITAKVNNPGQWTSETPVLYKAVTELKKGKETLHRQEEKFGFRTIEFRPNDGFYVNGTKVRFKGVCRHTFRPEHGRASSKAFAIEDVNLIKEMNMNAVRMSHYPPDRYFLDVCDSLGLYVIDELAGWQQPYDTKTAHRLIKTMVERDQNHPSIFMWANGNEGGFPRGVREDYGEHDIQKRRIVEPWSILDGLDAKHYPQWNYMKEALEQRDNVLLPTEFLHGFHDGGHGASLDDYWNLMRNSKLSAGGFLWNLEDEGLVRKDLNDSIDVAKAWAPDGILGPHLEKEGSFYAIKEIWSPVVPERPAMNTGFDGKVKVENRYHFTNLGDCGFSYTLTGFGDNLEAGKTREKRGKVVSPAVAPGQEGMLNLNLPSNWKSYDILSLTATDPAGREIYTWTWPISTPSDMAARLVKGSKQPVNVQETSDRLRIANGATELTFNKKDGYLENVTQSLRHVSFGNGPRFVGGESPKFSGMTHKSVPGGYEVVLNFDNGDVQRWNVREDGWVELDYGYTLDGDYDFAGITFDYPENKVKGAKLMGNGPYHMWKNREKGVTFDIHDKTYNNTITGQSWEYPEFKGYYSNLYAVKIDNEEIPFTIVTPDEGVYLHLFTPGRAVHASSNVEAPFPEGGLSFLNTIPGIGTKFSRAAQGGPQGEKTHYDNKKINNKLYFKFGE